MSDGSFMRAKVPISASVATTPRTVSSRKRRSMASPSGRSTRSRHTAGSTCARTSDSRGSGRVSVGATAAATSPTCS